MNEEKYIEINLVDLFRSIMKRLWWIAAAAIVFGGLAAAYSWIILPDIYQAEATVIISSQKNESDLTNISYNDYNLGLKLVNSYRIIAKTERVLSQVIEQTSLDISVKDLAKSIDVEAEDNTEIIKISVQNTNPDTAKIIANALVDVFQEEVTEIMKMDNVQVIDYARLPVIPIRPNRQRNTLIGIFAGVFIAAAFAIIIDLFDSTIASSEQMDKILGTTTFGIVPYLDVSKTNRKGKA